MIRLSIQNYSFFLALGSRDVHSESTDIVWMAMRNWRCPLLLRNPGYVWLHPGGDPALTQALGRRPPAPNSGLFQAASVLLVTLLQLTFCGP